LELTMGYVAQGATQSGITILKAARFTSPSCGPGKEWVPPVGRTAGYCRRIPSAGGQTATVRETPADAIRTKCNRFGFGSEKAQICEQWLRAGKPEAQLASVFACIDKGYTGQSLEICLDGRSKGASFTEIDTVINELAAQADAATQAQIAQEQAVVAARKRRTLFILGGVAAAGVAGFVIWKKRKARKRTAK
jgi:hypothetical protein